MRAAFILPCRNKEEYVGRCVKSILNQTYSPLEFLFSDQGSTDNTLKEIEKACDGYRGPNEIRILKCPHTEAVGMRGMNVHCNWLNQQTNADVIFAGSCDDINYPTRAERCMEVFEKYNPTTVHTAIDFVDPDGKWVGESSFPLEDRFVTGEENINHSIGGSTAMAWSREFYERVGGCHNAWGHDVYLPYLSTQDRGMYFIRESQYAYIRHSSPENLGLEGQFRAAKTEEERLQILELMHYQILSTFRAAAIKAEEMYPHWDGPDKNAILCAIAGRGVAWADVRDQMTLRKIQPILLRS